MGKRLFANPEICTGCNRCVYACSAEKVGMFQPSLARIHINNFPARGYSVPSICFHCPKPDCLQACQEEAIYKTDDGVVLVDREKCNGCGDCVAACTYGMIELDSESKAFKCDYCAGDPACIKQCEPNAILFAEADKTLRKINGRLMKQRIDTGSSAEKRNQLGKNLLVLDRP